jgi:hypothetical protein
VDQKYEPLSAGEAQNLDGARVWLKGHFTDHTEEKYESLDGKLRLLDAILINRWVPANDTAKLQSLGVCLGDALVQKLGLEWIMIDDEAGRTPAVRFPNTLIIAYPLAAIWKRIESGEDFDINDLFRGFCERLTEMKNSGQYDLI